MGLNKVRAKGPLRTSVKHHKVRSRLSYAIDNEVMMKILTLNLMVVLLVIGLF